MHDRICTQIGEISRLEKNPPVEPDDVLTGPRLRMSPYHFIDLLSRLDRDYLGIGDLWEISTVDDLACFAAERLRILPAPPSVSMITIGLAAVLGKRLNFRLKAHHRALLSGVVSEIVRDVEARKAKLAKAGPSTERASTRNV
jgi:hypothetical protein